MGIADTTFTFLKVNGWIRRDLCSALQCYSAVLGALRFRNFLPPPGIQKKDTVLQCSL